MTKVSFSFELTRPLDDVLLTRLADANSVYGIFFARPTPSLDGIKGEYDASRLSFAEVESALTRAGIPVVRKALTASQASS